MSMHVHWHEGLFLQPHHLQVMQRGLLERIRAERRLAWPFPYGVIECSVMRDQLENGLIVFEKLRIIMRSGIEINYPEDAEIPVLPIHEELARSTGAFSILLGVPEWKASRANASLPGQATNARAKILYGLKEISSPDENTGENPQPLLVRNINARLMFEKEPDMDALPLLRIQRAADRAKDQPRLDPSFVPPCLVLSASPTLQRLATELAAKVEGSRNDLAKQLARGGYSPEARMARTLKLRTLARFAGSLPALVAAPTVTPFEVYLVLRELLGELAAIKPSVDDFNSAAYDHTNPLPGFEDLDRKIRLLIPDDEGKFIQVPFNKNAHGNPQAALTDEHLTRTRDYFLGIRTRRSRTELATYLMQRSRFQVLPGSLEGYAIDGVALREEDVPGELPGDGGTYFRLLMREYEGWDTLKADKAVVLIWKNSEFDLADASFALYMTLS
jgi:type VI secretion system protein ImpJ